MGGSDSETTIIRYADYLETHHKSFLDRVASYASVYEGYAHSPYLNYTDVEIEDAFFGAGYTLSSFPSLYDMYGKFMAGLDIEVLFNQAFEDTVDGPKVAAVISSHAERLEDDITENVLPRFNAGMRDMNSVMSSTYVLGKTKMEVERTREISKYTADLQARLIPVATERWGRHLEWNKTVIGMYMEVLKMYIVAKLDVDGQNYDMAVKHRLWPFTVLTYYAAAVGALTNAQDIKNPTTSKSSRVLGGAAGGAAMGASIGGPVGAGIGAGVGALVGFLS